MKALELFLVALPAIFFVVDPLGTVPIFLTMTAGDPVEKTRRMALRACITGGCLLAFFAVFGRLLFELLGVTLAAFRVAGGILLLITALDMLRAKASPTRTSDEETREGAEKEDISIVPLAIPLLAGPGAMATVMVLASRGEALTAGAVVLTSIALTFAGSYFILRSAVHLQRVLKATGLAILHRVMGLLLAAVAVQFIAEGGRDLLGRP